MTTLLFMNKEYDLSTLIKIRTSFVHVRVPANELILNPDGCEIDPEVKVPIIAEHSGKKYMLVSSPNTIDVINTSTGDTIECLLATKYVLKSAASSVIDELAKVETTRPPVSRGEPTRPPRRDSARRGTRGGRDRSRNGSKSDAHSR